MALVFICFSFCVTESTELIKKETNNTVSLLDKHATRANLTVDMADLLKLLESEETHEKANIVKRQVQPKLFCTCCNVVSNLKTGLECCGKNVRECDLLKGSYSSYAYFYPSSYSSSYPSLSNIFFRKRRNRRNNKNKRLNKNNRRRNNKRRNRRNRRRQN